MAIATLADLKRHLNMTSSANDDELIDILDAAEDVVRGIAPDLEEQTYTETLDVIGDAVLLSHSPVISVASVSAFGETITGSSFSQYGAYGGLTGLSGWRRVTVTYTAGRTAPAILLATLIIAAHLWETQRMPGQSTESAPAGFGGLDGVPDAGTFGRGFAIPNRAQELLNRYVRPSVA